MIESRRTLLDCLAQVVEPQPMRCHLDALCGQSSEHAAAMIALTWMRVLPRRAVARVAIALHISRASAKVLVDDIAHAVELDSTRNN